MNPSNPAHPRQSWRRGIVLALPLLLTASLTFAANPGQQTFASPQAAVAALVEAVIGNDQASLLAILGPGGKHLIHAGDEAVDRHGRESFIQAYNDVHRIVLDSDAHATLEIGKDQWPFPIPVVKSAAGWFFDTREGEEEILARRIGRHELAAIQACRAIVAAEQEFFAHSGERDALSHYAARFIGNGGKRDGLYRENPPGGPSSSIDARLAGAGVDRDPAISGSAHAPYHGYFFRILTAQGADAPGGARNYVVNGKLTGGFAVLAFPVLYGVSGVMSFMADKDGVVFEKDLGNDTAAVAARMTAFNPDASWKRVAVAPARPER